MNERTLAINDLFTRIQHDEFVTQIVFSKNRANQKLRREDQQRLDDAFKLAAIKAVGLTGHPKAEKAWELAHAGGRNEGKHAVLRVLVDFADLLLD